VSHDVVAYLIEIISGKPLDVYFTENLFEPLGMVDTAFYTPREKLDRLAAQYGSANITQPDITFSSWFEDAEKGINRLLTGPLDGLESKPHNIFRGGHGLVSTAHDYLQFCRMLLNNGELNGTRFLGRKTVELITTNQLPPEMIPYEIGGIYYFGYGYGLGFRVLMDVGQCYSVGSVGEFGWAGAADTYFWIDPKEDFIGIQMSQFQPGGYHLIAQDFRVMSYQSIVD
jgi:CubicO group peptidase (beta-lactamase class C family)